MGNERKRAASGSWGPLRNPPTRQGNPSRTWIKDRRPLGRDDRPGPGRAGGTRKWEAFIHGLPGSLQGEGRELARLFQQGAPVQAEGMLEWLPNLVRVLPLETAEQAVRQAVRIARVSVSAAHAFLCRLLRIVGTLDREELVQWVDQGIRLLERNRSAGRAYFELDSRSARQGLKRAEQAVWLEEIIESLRLYVSGICGKRLEVQSTGPALASAAPPVETPWAFPFSDGRTIYLPPAVRAFATYQENRLFYRIQAAHQAGYYEYDSFGFGLFAFLERLKKHPALSRWKPRLTRPDNCEDFLSDLQVFFHLFPRPGLARRIFTIVEDGRVDARLRHRYAGLKADMAPYVAAMLAKRPGPDRLPPAAAVLEMLVRISLDPEQALARASPGTAFLQGMVASRLAPVFRPGASVDDAAMAAAELYWLTQAILKGTFPALGSWPGLGDALEARGPLPAEVPLAETSLLEAITTAGEARPDDLEALEDMDLPLELRGNTDLGAVQKGLRLAEHVDSSSGAEDPGGIRRLLSLEELKRLLERGLDVTIETAREEGMLGPGLFFHGPMPQAPLLPKLKARQSATAQSAYVLALLRREQRRSCRDPDAAIFYYDEWDHTIQDYRPEWCRLLEKEVRPEDAEFFATVRAAYGPLIPSVRKQFERLRPEAYRRERSLPDGEEIDLDRAVENLVDRMCGLPGTGRLYQERRRVARDVCTIFLVDMSSSTSEPVSIPVLEDGASPGAGGTGPGCPGENAGSAASIEALAWAVSGAAPALSRTGVLPEGSVPGGAKRIIDVEKEALVLLAEALEALGDRYGIYGFSGCGRMQVEFFTIKDLGQRYTSRVKERIGAIEPRGSTRMGTALRHCRTKLSREDARRKNLFLISDGFPQDQDYGFDRTSHEYGVQDTARALAELASDGTYTYCITVDRRGEDYLKRMCPESQYMVIHDVLSLPEVLLKIYHKVTA